MGTRQRYHHGRSTATSWITLAALTSSIGCAASQSHKGPSPVAPEDGAAAVAAEATASTRQQTAEAYQAECNADLAKATTLLDSLESRPEQQTFTVANTLLTLNEFGIILDRAMNRASLWRNVHPFAEVRKAADQCEQEFSKLNTRMSLSRPVFDAVTAIDATAAHPLTQRYIQHVLRDFRRSGVDKDEATRAKIKALSEKLVKIGQDFDRNIATDVRTIALSSADDLAGLPQDYIDAHPPSEDGTITLTTDYPDVYPFMRYAHSDEARLALYKAFRQRGYPKNQEVLKAMLEGRHELAQLLGYENWAHYITEDKMIKDPTQAATFIDRIAKLAKPRADRDYQEMLARLQQIDPKAEQVGDWQKEYLETLIKREKYAFDSQEVRQYFSYERVRQGLFDLTSKLFGISYRPAPHAERWHADVEAYEVLSQSGDLIGRFYLDMHPRADKYKHAAAFPILAGVRARQLPEAALVCNFPGGKGNADLMEHLQVETFFHEFGHLLHHLFAGEQRWIRFSGISTEWDFVEAPSQMLEEWTWDANSLHTFAVNGAGEKLPNALITAMRRARSFGKGAFVRHQMFYASLSLNYYNRDPEGLDTTAMLKDLQARYSPFGYVNDTHFQYSFGHLDGYSAIYYTYMWSLVIAKDLFSVFEREGLLNPEPAGRYRANVLEPGGSRDAADLVSSFLGRDYSIESFARWLDGSGD